jgi:two-component system, NtrC family, sensor kinase
MAYDLQDFSVGEMLRCGLAIRKITKEATSMEDAASAIIGHLYDECVDAETGQNACLLVRFYKTHPFAELDPGLQDFARRQLGREPTSSAMKCLTLLASTGDRPEWRSRHRSREHKAIPLPSEQMVEQAPMIAQLIKQLGVDVKQVIGADPQLVPDLKGKTYNVFYVDEARGSPYIPAQKEFVSAYGVRSVIGFGGLLRSGDLFAVIMFTRVRVPRESADRFKSVALDVKSVLFRFQQAEVFASAMA